MKPGEGDDWQQAYSIMDYGMAGKEQEQEERGSAALYSRLSAAGGQLRSIRCCKYTICVGKVNECDGSQLNFADFNRGDFVGFFSMYCFIQACFICGPSDSTVSEDAGIEPRTVATSPLAVRRSNHYARSHPHLG